MSIYQKYLVCYDISNNKTRRKINDFLKDIGLTDIQKSVFWGELTKAEFTAMKREAKKLLNKDEDKMFWIITSLTPEQLKQGVGYESLHYVAADGHFSL